MLRSMRACAFRYVERLSATNLICVFHAECIEVRVCTHTPWETLPYMKSLQCASGGPFPFGFSMYDCWAHLPNTAATCAAVFKIVLRARDGNPAYMRSRRLFECVAVGPELLSLLRFNGAARVYAMIQLLPDARTACTVTTFEFWPNSWRKLGNLCDDTFKTTMWNTARQMNLAAVQPHNDEHIIFEDAANELLLKTLLACGATHVHVLLQTQDALTTSALSARLRYFEQHATA